jgi:hypothetical protein
MPRNFDVSLEASWDSQRHADPVVVALTIIHAQLDGPVRACSSPYMDNIGHHVIGGLLHRGIPFQITLPSDDDRPPRGRLELLNYGLIVGRAAKAMQSRPRVIIEKYAARDFTKEMPGDPPAHQPVGTPRRIYRAAWLTIVNVTIGTTVTGDLAVYGADPTTYPASPLRATILRAPGLFV